MKTCRVCKVVKPKTAFYLRDNAADGRRSECKLCAREAVRDNAALKREPIRERMRVYQKSPEQVAKRRAYAKSARGREVRRLMQRAYRAFLGGQA